MAKPSNLSSNSRVITVSEDPKLVILRSLVACRVVATGVSGVRYEWPSGGSEVKVLEQDSEAFLKQYRFKDRSCCGGDNDPKPVFELVLEV